MQEEFDEDVGSGMLCGAAVDLDFWMAKARWVVVMR
jgi:hypothetical protein